MAKTAYFDCFSGCSGDMILGSLIDAGLSLEKLEKGLRSMPLEGYKLSAEKVKRSMVSATKFNVEIDKSAGQPERHLNEILGIIEKSKLPVEVKKTAGEIFLLLGEVESEVHNVPLEDIHFHEIGAVDSIVDIVGSVYGFHLMGIEYFYSSPLPPGSGTIRTSHGILPVPVPATLGLLARANAPLTGMPAAGQSCELVTPTGAAIVTFLAKFGSPAMTMESAGCGAGTKDFKEWPNIMRILVGEETGPAEKESLVLLETNIDDMNPEIYGYVMEKLFAAGAADVWFTPIQMKKNRPAVMLSVIASSHLEQELTGIIMRETSTLGIRVRSISRHVAEREVAEFKSSLGLVKVKVKRFQGKIVSIHPEYEDCRRIAEKQNIPLQEVYRIVEDEALKKMGK